ncbi:MAG: NAD(P)-binding domain-containing protein [Planctomycetota bacterium]|nr:NAD(P)-binding domain-containing protein [Planctomycetota bacterium]
MSWPLLCGVVLALGLALLAAIARRMELLRMERTIADRDRAVRHGSNEAQLQHPVVDLSRCLGCGTCVDVCPEDGVLELVHGQAVVVNGARCVGVSACERNCPVGAIAVTLTNLEERRDIPVLGDDLEAIGAPNLFLAGELTAHALIKTAIEHGTAVAAEVARRSTRDDAPKKNGSPGRVFDLCIVGAGPAGLACSLEAKRLGLSFVTLDQEPGVGGTVAKYPRRKLVMSQPVDLPLHGRLQNLTYTKEELMDLWTEIVDRHELPIRQGQTVLGLERRDDGCLVVHTDDADVVARHVCLALGRRGTPRKLGVPGEELPKVAYSLLDAHSYRDRRVLVVGGGDSAVEAAMGLAEQPGNRVTLSYRKDGFFRPRAKNYNRLQECLEQDKLEVILESEVEAIHADRVDLVVQNGAGPTRRAVPNDDVFVMAGGMMPFDLLERAGVSFDPTLRPPQEKLSERGTGLIQALTAGFVLALFALVFALWNIDYYSLDAAGRAQHPKHELLRPSLSLGLWLGIAAATLIVVNLLYLVRRSPKVKFNLGSLQTWMTSHVATGILAFLCATLHGAMSPRETPGGYAYWAMVVLLLTGAIGRYFYAYVPRAANGRELELTEVKTQLSRISEEWDQGQRQFNAHVRDEVLALVEKRQWSDSFLRRVVALLGVHRSLQKTLARLENEGRAQGIAEGQIQESLGLARRAHRTALMAAHYEDLRAILGSWRYFHRWVSVLMVLLVLVHVGYALSYSARWFGGTP